MTFASRSRVSLVLGVIGLFLVLQGCDRSQPLLLSDQTEEEKAIASNPGFATREGRSLTINIGKDIANPVAVKIFRDAGSCETYEGCVRFSIDSIDSASRTIILWATFFEGADAILLNQLTGNAIYLENMPVASPNRAFWALADDDLASGSGEIQVIARDQSGFKIVARSFGSDAGLCSFQAWRSDKAFTILCSDITSQDPLADEYLISQTETGAWIEAPTGRRVVPPGL